MSALQLLLAVGLAAALIESKARAFKVELGESPLEPLGRLRARLPLGWESVDPSNLPTGAVLGLREPTRPPGGGRRLFLFHGYPGVPGPPSGRAGAAMIRTSQSVAPRMTLDWGRIEGGRVGPWPGFTLVTAASPVFGGGPSVFCLARAAVAPAGQIFGALLALPQQPRQRDHELLEAVSAHLELDDARIATDPAAVMRAAGIHFEPPGGALFVKNSAPDLPRVRMCGGEEWSYWLLQIHRVPLIADRTPEQLVQACARADRRKMTLPQPVETTSIEGRSIAHVEFSTSAEVEPSSFFYAAQTDDHTALLLMGSCEWDAAPVLRSACRSIAGTAEVRPYNDLVNIEQARDVARRCLAEVAAERTAPVWNALAGTSYTDTGRAPGMTVWQRMYTVRREVSDDGFVWWGIDSVLRYDERFLQGDRGSAGKCRIRDDTAAYECRYVKIEEGGSKSEWTERRAAGSNEVEFERQDEDGIHQARLAVDDTFACPTVLWDRATARLAGEPERGPAIFGTTHWYDQHIGYVVVVPLGRVELPGGEPGQTAWAVREQWDSSLTSATCYFDDQSRLRVVEVDNGAWYERAYDDDARGGAGQAFGMLR